ncbi:hypothetical protein MMC25_006015, partial [Agyrium rufum]|nr:hypothetical protein [Agyrium rufum]
MATSSDPRVSQLIALVNHLALPPQLPHRQEQNLESIHPIFVDRFLDAARAVEESGELENLKLALRTCKILNRDGRLQKQSLLEAFRELHEGQFLILYVTAQNVALIIRRDHHESKTSVLFEAFEASPRCEDVLASQSALQWDFPGSAVSIPWSEFSQPAFQNELASFLGKASTESIKRFAVHISKAGSSISETRDTVNPTLVTTGLMTLLEGLGCRYNTDILRKRVRDEVSWGDGPGENPWRRAPFWLIVRVSVQRYLSSLRGGEIGRLLYKAMVCRILSTLLTDCGILLPLDLAHHLKAKLCRRIVKLQLEKQRDSHQLQKTHEFFSDKILPVIASSVDKTNSHINSEWETFKKAIQRPVPPLPRRADEGSLYLKLPNSAAYIQGVLSIPSIGQIGNRAYDYTRAMIQNNDLVNAVAKPAHAFANRYFTLATVESEIRDEIKLTERPEVSPQHRCRLIASRMEIYLDSVGNAYDYNPEQKSIMLLDIMALWVVLDKGACEMYPLLRHFNPVFHANMFDILQLSSYEDMSRLQHIRIYLQKRLSQCKTTHKTIFEDPSKGCFAERYYMESNDASRLANLHRGIETAAELTKSRKEKEWRNLCVKYDELVRKIANTACIYMDDSFGGKIHNDRSCRKCYLERKRRRFSMQASEYALPENELVAKVVVFELGCPATFSTYRDMTWRIIARLALPTFPEAHVPTEYLHQYSELLQYKNPDQPSLSLASTTKSCLKTHYAKVKFPTNLADVCLKNGLKLRYHDFKSGIWTKQVTSKMTFAHHMQVVFPKDSPLFGLHATLGYGADSATPSSYEIIASQTKCPSGMNVQEFMAYQALHSGRTRRWAQILVELGAVNLNFSTEAVSLAINRLALEVGPLDHQNTLGEIHAPFQDVLLGRQLARQLDRRLENLASNYREFICMETILTLVVRIATLGKDLFSEAMDLVYKARSITHQWLSAVRSESEIAQDPTSSHRCSLYMVWASLLCRRTYAVSGNDDKLLDPAALQCFLECGTALQDNLSGDPATLPRFLKNSLIRDLKLVHQMRRTLRQSLEASPESLLHSLSSIWSSTLGTADHISTRFEFLGAPNDGWVEVRIAGNSEFNSQVIHYHLFEGHLLVMGKPVGKLPAEHRGSTVVQQLFGNQALLTYSSSLPGMTYVLAKRSDVQGHQIHLGVRDGKLIVRALLKGKLMELIPAEVFGSQSDFDLPASLVQNCVHWLDLSSGMIEIRQKPNIWRSKDSNWIVNFLERFGIRRRVKLVDPHSRVFHQIAKIFEMFEYPMHLTVYQPLLKGRLSVEMRRLELRFSVNARNLLESEQLQAEIIGDQDAGTWYGLNSKIVLREIISRRDSYSQPLQSEPGRHKIIIVPLGELSFKRHGPHVTVTVSNGGNYARYTINEVLKRLDCPAEPRLLYLKAQYHAYTSFFLPDSLTARTGTEEALHILRSGQCQPWIPLTKPIQSSLQSLAQLTPNREYYPVEGKTSQVVRLSPLLTTYIQSDAYRSVAEDLRAKSIQLSLFVPDSDDFPPLDHKDVQHLTLRSRLRRQTYERPNVGSLDQSSLKDLEYIARDRLLPTQNRKNILECVGTIRSWPSKLSTPKDLVGILQSWSNVGGFDCFFDKVLLTDILEADFPSQLGQLVKLCQKLGHSDKYKLLFLFATMALRLNVEMMVVRTLMVFVLLPELKQLEPPIWPRYDNFRSGDVPRADSLIQMVKSCLIPFEGDQSDDAAVMLNPKARKKLHIARFNHVQQQEKDTKAFVEDLLQQWPCNEPSLEAIASPASLVDFPRAYAIIRPEWQRLFQNYELSCYISKVQLILDQCRKGPKLPLHTLEQWEHSILPTRVHERGVMVVMDALLVKGAMSDGDKCVRNEENPKQLCQQDETAVTGPIMNQALGSLPSSSVLPPKEVAELRAMVESFAKSSSTVRQQYGMDLKLSLTAFETVKIKSPNHAPQPRSVQLSQSVTQASNQCGATLERLLDIFSRDEPNASWLRRGGMWPAITPATILEHLRSTSKYVFGSGMKKLLVEYAMSLTELQRLIRIEDAQRKSQLQKVKEELENVGHSN